jgi:ligand-binding SRPBCC domain-containing protein
MKRFTLITSTRVPAPIDRVFDFFARAENLERLTPAFLGFRILTPPPLTLAKGTIIDYRISLHGLPIRWRSEITEWDPPHKFVDEQRRGPYRRWTHVHEFAVDGDGTIVIDRVSYAIWGGTFVNAWLVAPDLRRVFTYRHSALAEVFGGSSSPLEIVLR